MDLRRFHRRLFESARELLCPGETIICAVSGGADSMAMLHGLLKVSEIHECGWRLCVAHLDHGLPYDSASVERFVRGSAESGSLPYYSDKADVPSLSKQMRLSIEEAGRSVRYEFLLRASAHLDARTICTAHHADDQAETVLHRITRGTGLAGLAGIPRARVLSGGVRVVRPMLGFAREELRSYLRQRGLSHMEDPTNRDLTAAARNRIRHDLLPKLTAEYNPRIARALVRLARQAELASTAMRELAQRMLTPAIETQDDMSMTLRVAEISGLSRGVQAEMVRLLIERLGCRQQSIGSNRIDAAVELLRGGSQKRRIEMSGLLIERRGRIIRFTRMSQSPKDPPGCRQMKESAV